MTIDRLRDMLALRNRLVDQRTVLKTAFDEIRDPVPDGPALKYLSEPAAGVRK